MRERESNENNKDSDIQREEGEEEEKNRAMRYFADIHTERYFTLTEKI